MIEDKVFFGKTKAVGETLSEEQVKWNWSICWIRVREKGEAGASSPSLQTFTQIPAGADCGLEQVLLLQVRLVRSCSFLPAFLLII